MKFFLIYLIICLFTFKGFSQFFESESANCIRIKRNKKTDFKINNNPLLQNYDIHYYHLDLNIENNSTYIKGFTSIKASVIHSLLHTFVIELSSDLTVDSVHVEDRKQTFIHQNHEINIYLDYPFKIGRFFDVKVFYHGLANGNGISTAYKNNKSFTWTISESFHAKDWFACKQILSDKADSVFIAITTDEKNKVASNGLLKNIVRQKNNKVRYEWKSNYPIVYYLIAVAVGEYEEYSFYAHPKGKDSILIQNFVYDSTYLEKKTEQITKIKQIIELFSDLYGNYPFEKEKYGHCLAPIDGGMEHQTITLLNDFNFTLIAHELGHQWFGNNVTCNNWQDIWINEGFASYSEYLALYYLKGKKQAEKWLNDAFYYASYEEENSVYVPLEESQNEMRIFSFPLSYQKGAILLHMIRFELQNEQLFFNVLQTFQKVYQGKTATALDFKKILEKLSKKNFTDFFNQWYFGEGYPVYSLIWYQDNENVSLVVEQETTSSSTKLFKMKMQYKLELETKDTIIETYQTSKKQTFNFKINEQVKNIEIDPNNWVLNEVGSIEQGENLNSPYVTYFNYSPNPFKNEFQLNFIKDNINRYICLIDVTGRKFLEIETKKQVVVLNTENLKNGIYFVKVSDGKNYRVKKIMKIE